MLWYNFQYNTSQKPIHPIFVAVDTVSPACTITLGTSKNAGKSGVTIAARANIKGLRRWRMRWSLFFLVAKKKSEEGCFAVDSRPRHKNWSKRREWERESCCQKLPVKGKIVAHLLLLSPSRHKMITEAGGETPLWEFKLNFWSQCLVMVRLGWRYLFGQQKRGSLYVTKRLLSDPNCVRRTYSICLAFQTIMGHLHK